MHFGEWMDARREAIALPKYKIAPALGVHINTYRSWTVDSDPPRLTPAGVAKFARVLKVEPLEVVDAAGLLPPELRALAVETGLLPERQTGGSSGADEPQG